MRMGVVPTNRDLDGSALPHAGRGESEDQASDGSREAQALALDEFSISQLRQFFELLDEWDRKATREICDDVQSSTKAKGAAGGAQG